MPVPIIAAGISAGAGLAGQVFGHGTEKRLMNAQTGLAQQQTGLSKMLGEFAKKQYTMAQPAQAKALQYYMTQATGNRGATANSLAPQYGAISDIYRGAERGIESHIAPGSGRDTAIADMYRQRTQQSAMLPFLARQEAMDKLGTFGSEGVRTAMDAYGQSSNAAQGASGINQSAYGMAQQRGQGMRDVGASFGKMFLPYILEKYANKRGGPDWARGQVNGVEDKILGGSVMGNGRQVGNY